MHHTTYSSRRRPLRITHALSTLGLLAGFLALPATAAQASPSPNFGTHLSACAQHTGFSGSHNPSMHRADPAGDHICHH